MEESAQQDFDAVTDEEELDVADQEVDVSPSPYPVDVFQLESGVEVNLPKLPLPRQSQDVSTELAESGFPGFTNFIFQQVAGVWSYIQQLQ